MARPEILDGAAVQVLLDDGGTDVRGTRYRRRVPQPLGDAAHHARERPLLRRRAVRRLRKLCERDGGLERPSPRPEILRREFLAHVALDVLVELPSGEVPKLAVELVAEELPPARNPEQILHGAGDLGVHDRGPDLDPVLRAEAKDDRL